MVKQKRNRCTAVGDCMFLTAAWTSLGIFRYLSEATPQMPAERPWDWHIWCPVSNITSGCFSNRILLHLDRQKQTRQVICVQMCLLLSVFPWQNIQGYFSLPPTASQRHLCSVYLCCLSVPLMSSVYSVLPDALILPAAPREPLNREKALTPFSAKVWH